MVNRCLENYLRCFATNQPRSWSLWLPWAEFWYNSTFHGSTGKSPFEVVYGRQPPTVFQFLPGEVQVPAVALDLRDRDEALRQLKSHLQRAQLLMKTQADKKRRDVQFSVGDWVYVKLKPYRQMSVSNRIHQKLAARFFGPFQIVTRIGQVAYKLELPPSSRIHPVFHVSLLKKAERSMGIQVLPPELELGAADMFVPDKVLAFRKFNAQRDRVDQLLIQWKGLPADKATWEDTLTIKSQFPELSLEDKTPLEGGSNDTNRELFMQNEEVPKVLKVYSRKGKRAILENS